ncbi:MAG: sigma E protease regulator RseP [Sodalis sp. (in: enterobacteria)]
MLHVFWNLAAFILASGILITVHEFGHFWVARCCGVIVKCFSIGFGRVLWRRRDKYGIEYVISAIPLGGYVKMLDERVDSVTPEQRHETFNYKPIWQRSAIIIAGPVFNFLFAIVAYWFVFLIGVPSYLPVIGEVSPNSIAAQAGIFPGLQINSVNDIATPDWDAVRLQLINKIGDNEVSLVVAPVGYSQGEKKILDLHGWKFDSKKEDTIVALGIIPIYPRIDPVLAEVQPGSAAMTAGLQAGDRIIKVDGEPVSAWQFFVSRVRENPGCLLQLSIERQGGALDITLQPDTKLVGKGKIEGFAGVVPKIVPLAAEYKTVRQYSPFSALCQATEKTWLLMRLMLSMLVKLVTQDIKLNNLSGPIAIAEGAGVSAEYGLIYYLMFLALISINVGIVNLFPLPVLDGGHLLFLMIEKFKGSPVTERVQNFSYRIGSILLVLLMGLSILNDFSRL